MVTTHFFAEAMEVANNRLVSEAIEMANTRLLAEGVGAPLIPSASGAEVGLLGGTFDTVGGTADRNRTGLCP